MRRRIEHLFLIAILLALTAFSLDWAFKGAIHHQKEAVIPDLTGKSLNDALEILSGLNLGLKKENAEFNESVPVGTILRQHPASGLKVREGKLIRVTVSQGGERISVPDLTGQTLRSAEITLRNNLLSLGEIRLQPSLKYNRESVISQDPAPQTAIGKGGLVHLTVSNGPPVDGSILMPDFTRRKWEEVETWSKKFGIRCARKEQVTTSDPETVIEQSILPDTVLNPGTNAVFVVAVQSR